MAQFSTQVPHQLGRDGARARLEQVLPRLAAGFGDEVRDLEGAWHGHELHYGFTAVGLKIQGKIIVEETAAHVHCQLPLAAMLFRGRLEKEIHSRLGEVLAATTEP